MLRITFTPTEARQKFFDLLKLAAIGREPIIESVKQKKRFKISVVSETKDKSSVMKKMSAVNLDLKNKSWLQIKAMVSERYSMNEGQ